ncbi:MAG: hypothetical protein L0Y71_11060, partial [Gemmataceae bacterium]|nr:hypothetical protein [Gemmataceae bacterium]
MSSDNRITATATVAGPPPSPNGPASFSPGSKNRGGHNPTPQPQPANPDRPSANGDSADTPSANGREADGRFAPGNAGGPGNPFARLVADLRRACIEAVGREGLVAIFLK